MLIFFELSDFYDKYATCRRVYNIKAFYRNDNSYVLLAPILKLTKTDQCPLPL